MIVLFASSNKMLASKLQEESLLPIGKFCELTSFKTAKESRKEMSELTCLKIFHPISPKSDPRERSALPDPKPHQG